MGKLEVTAVMEDSLPTIQEDAPFNVVSAMLEHYPAILVSKEGKIRGIISKSDLLNVMLK
jgi:predicted transcriptional regulator